MDYRFFPEPDLPPLVITPEEVAQARAGLPELPEARAGRFQEAFALTAYEAGMLLQTPGFAAFFEAVAAGCGNGKQAANWMLGEVSRVLNDRAAGLEALGLEPASLAGLIRLVAQGAINLKTAKEVVFPALLAGEGAPEEIVRARGLGQVSDRGRIQELVAAVLAAHAGPVAEFRAGKVMVRGFLVGQVMKAGKGQVDPRLVNECVDAALAPGKE